MGRLGDRGLLPMHAEDFPQVRRRGLLQMGPRPPASAPATRLCVCAPTALPRSRPAMQAFRDPARRTRLLLCGGSVCAGAGPFAALLLLHTAEVATQLLPLWVEV